MIAKVLGPGRQEEAEHMFMTIDANSTGRIDLEGITNFMMLKDKGEMAMEDDTLLNFSEIDLDDLGRTNHNLGQHLHTDMIQCMIAMEKHTVIEKPDGSSQREGKDRYITGGRDGTLKFWQATTGNHLKTVKVGDSWISGMTYMKQSGHLAVISMDRILHIYNPHTYERISIIRDSGAHRHFAFSPSCVDSAVLHDGHEILMMGDDGGNLLLYRMTDPKWHIGSGRPGQKSQTRHVQISRVFNLHNDWVTKVMYDHRIGLVITASLDCTIKMVDPNKIVSQQHLRRTFRGHSKGVYSFAFSKKFKFMVSCGLERKLI